MDAPIELVLENNVLVAREFSLIEGADGESGVSVRCSDGSCSCYVQSMQPTEREFHDIKLPQRRILYARKRALVIDQADLDPDNLPWVEYNSAGIPVPGTDSAARLEAWLDERVSGERLENWIDGRISEYGVALDILEALPAAVLTVLGLREVNLGGPASSVPALQMTGSPERFNWIMRKHKLPFVIISEDEDSD